jgi:hypothetical protein
MTTRLVTGLRAQRACDQRFGKLLLAHPMGAAEQQRMGHATAVGQAHQLPPRRLVPRQDIIHDHCAIRVSSTRAMAACTPSRGCAASTTAKRCGTAWARAR